MANSDKDILITPNSGSSSADPKIEYVGANSSGNDTITVETLYDGTKATLSFEGSAGQLFSIVNDLSTDPIFSVNDVSGIPSIEVDSDGEIRLAEFSGNVGIGISTPTELLHVDGRIKANNLTLASLSAQNSEATSLMIDGSGIVGTRELGSNAFNSTTIPTNNNQLTNGASYITSSALSGYATESYVTTQVNNLIDSAPGALNTLNELAAAINDDASFSTTVTNSIATKLPLAGGTLTGNLTIGSTTDSTKIVFPDKNVPDNPTAASHDRQLISMGNSGAGGLFQTTGRGGLMLASADDSVIIASGDVGRNYDPDAGGYHPDADNEEIYLLTDGGVRFMTNLQTSASYKQFIFDNSGNATIPGNITVSGTVDGRDVATDGTKLDTIATNADVTPSWVPSSNPSYLTGNQTITLSGDVSGSGTTSISVSVTDDSHFHHRLDSTDDRDMKPSTSGIAGSVQALKPFFSSYGGMTGSANTVYVDVLAFDTYSDSSGGGPSAITFKKGNASGNPEMHIWKAAWNASTWGAGQRVFADNYHPNADTLTTARTIAGTSFDGSANIDISYNNLTNKPTIPTNNNQLTNGAGYITSFDITTQTDSKYLRSNAADTGTGQITLSNGLIAGTNGVRIRRQDTNGTIWFNGSSATDNNHALWNAYYGNSPTTRGGANTGFDGIYWNTYRGIHLRTGLAGAYNSIVVQNSSGSTNDHTVTLYAANVARLATSTSGISVTGNIAVSGTVDGRDVASDGSKLDGIESGATADQTQSQINALGITATGLSGTPNITVGTISSGAITSSGIVQAAGALRVTETGTVQSILIGNQDSAGVNKPAMIQGVNGYLRFGHGSSWSGEGGTFTEVFTTSSNDVNIGDGSANSRILLKKADNNNADHIIFHNGTTRTGEIGSKDDTWLRINDITNKNIYTPRYIRADSGFFIDGTSKGIDGTGNFIGGGTITSGAITSSGRISAGEEIRMTGSTGVIRGDQPFGFVTISGSAQNVRTKSVFAGTSYGDTPPAGSVNATNTYELNGNTVINSDRYLGNVVRNYLSNNFTGTYINASGDYLNIQTGTGYTRIGSANTTYSHFYTDRSKYYFNKGIHVDTGVIRSHDEDLQLQRAGTTGIKITSSSVIIGDVPENDDFSTVELTTMAGNGRLVVGDGEIFMYGNQNSNAEFKFTSNGTLHCDNDVIAFSSTISSDRKLKENIQPIEGGLNKILKLKGVSFDWKDEKKENNQLGFIAQEVEEVLPELVKEVETLGTENETHKVVNYDGVIPVLVEAIKMQQKQIDRLSKLLEDK